jgi:probable F420-dependent oxidoreductase
MFGYLAAVTTTLELVTKVVILPQRQTVLVAKQAADVDLLSHGRLRLGVGVGWNAVEYEALGENFTNRGKRLDEQVELMRRLWTEQTMTFDGAHHRVTGAGLAPLPVQRPIPVWIGAFTRRALERAGRLADGWFPPMSPGPELDEAREIVARSAIAAGRDPATIGMEAHVTWRGDRQQFADELAQWAAAGASHASVDTMGAGLRTVDEHVAALAVVADILQRIET